VDSLSFKMGMKNNRKGAMEMSVGTMVTIVLLMVVLVLGIFFIQRIFNSGNTALDQINDATQNQINQLFASNSGPTVVLPASQSITIKRGDTPKGFAFEVKNPDNLQATFSYNVSESSMHNCGILTADEANSFLIAGTGTFVAGPGAQSSQQFVRFDVPSTEPACTVVYNLQISGTGSSTFIDSKNIFVTIQ
jgi:hypothetical protein